MQAHQGAFFVAEVADNLAKGLWQLADQCGDGHNLVACCQLRVLEQINNFDIVAAGQVFFA
ncbi:MAG TPA: hypothetical protein VIV15_10215, partial [Anaerolineales bacterium]